MAAEIRRARLRNTISAEVAYIKRHSARLYRRYFIEYYLQVRVRNETLGNLIWDTIRKVRRTVVRSRHTGYKLDELRRTG